MKRAHKGTFQKSSTKAEEQEPLSGGQTVYESVSRPLTAFTSYIRHGIQTVRESLFALLVSTLTAVSAGVFLSRSEELLLLIPGLIILVPGALDIRGAIFGALGSRLGSALHLGYIEEFSLSNRHVRRNIYSTMTQTIVVSVLLAFFAKLLASFFGFADVSLFELIAISFLGGVIAGLILLFMTFLIAMKSYQRGWDPDNIHAPLITALGDFITVPSLLLATTIVLDMRPFLDFFVISVITVALANAVLLFRHEDKDFKRAVFISLAAVTLSGFVSSMSGILLHSNIERLVAVPTILIMLPAFLGQGGNIGNTLASRISTKLHLGQLDPELRLEREIKREFVSSYLLAAIVFVFVAVLTHIADIIFHIPALGLKMTLAISLFAGIALTTIVIMLTFLISVMAYRHKVDPDDVTIPLITALADIMGVFALIATLGIFGII
ncbi:MAG: magnesium transporter [Candidatus Aenigmarchaeota archaeon]|nr:magnesium transporter [Candidatus Aenigmarchaeota archaeon]